MTRSRTLPASWLSFPSRASWVRQASRRSPSVSSARPSKPTSVIRLQDFVGPQASSTSSAVWPWAPHTSRSTPRTSSELPLICREPPCRVAVSTESRSWWPGGRHRIKSSLIPVRPGLACAYGLRRCTGPADPRPDDGRGRVSEKKMFGGLAFLPARAGSRRRLAGPISRAAGAALAFQGAAHGTELDLGLGEFGGGIRARDDAAAGEQPGGTAGKLGTAQRDAPLAVAVGVDPADRAGVTLPVHVLELADEFERGAGRGAADRGGRVDRRGQAQR